MLVFLLLHVLYFSVDVHCDCRNQEAAIEQVKFWSDEIGKELKKLSEAMTRKSRVKESFSRLKDQMYMVNANSLTEKVALDLKKLMSQKENATKLIADFAEILAYHRKKEPLFPNGTYHYFNADNFTEPGSTAPSKAADLKLRDYIDRVSLTERCLDVEGSLNCTEVLSLEGKTTIYRIYDEDFSEYFIMANSQYT